MTWAGVTTLLVDDGCVGGDDRRLLLPASLATVGLGQIAPSASAQSTAACERMGVDRLEAVLPVHTHFDHAIDSAAGRPRAGARLVGGESAAPMGVGGGLSEDRSVSREFPANPSRWRRRHTGGGGTLSAGRFPGVITRLSHRR